MSCACHNHGMSDSDDSSIEELPPPKKTTIRLEDMKTLRQLYAEPDETTLKLRPVEDPEFPFNDKLLDLVSLVQGDITKLEVDCIVNAANSTLLGGGGVDGAIHRAAGPELQDACRTLKSEMGVRCETGDSKITGAFNLPSKNIIHTVGPSPRGDEPTKEEEEELASCYKTSMELAAVNGLHHIAFCAISTGIYGYPIKAATRIALREARLFLGDGESPKLERIIFVVFNPGLADKERDQKVYRAIIPYFFPVGNASKEIKEVDLSSTTVKPEVVAVEEKQGLTQM